MNFYLLFIYFLNVNAWSHYSWRTKIPNQLPTYLNKDKLIEVENKLSSLSPLVFAEECDNLQEALAKASVGNSFILFGGPCAESFNDFSTNNVRDTYRLILQMGMILTYAKGIPICKIGRNGGQFAKPRSDEYEIINNTKVLTYRGDIINDINDRTPNPERMLDAYYQSLQTINILRAFSNGGYASINRIHAWNLDFVEKTKEGSKYRELANKVTKSLQFIKGLGVNINDDKFTTTNIYTSHECLLLNYEEALTRIYSSSFFLKKKDEVTLEEKLDFSSNDSRTNKSYVCSGHLLWIGERTRQIDGAHVEFMRGINNPIGIKLSEKIKPDELVDLINILNPNNIPGKIVLITRMGIHLKNKLPELIRVVQKNAFSVVWCCDPMHGNTIKTKDGIKTRTFESIKNEVIEFFKIHKKLGTYPGGLHLELTPDNVTECIGGEIDTISESDLSKMYLSQCDPRLNAMQSLELAFIIADLL